MWGLLSAELSPLPSAELSPLPSLGHQSTPSPLEGLQGVGSVEAHVTNGRIVHSGSRCSETPGRGAQTQQSRVQGPLLQPRKGATGSGMSGMKQSSCSFQRQIRRELVLMPFGPRAGMAGEVRDHHGYLRSNLGTQGELCLLGTNVVIPLGLMVSGIGEEPRGGDLSLKGVANPVVQLVQARKVPGCSATFLKARLGPCKIRASLPGVSDGGCRCGQFFCW